MLLLLLFFNAVEFDVKPSIYLLVLSVAYGFEINDTYTQMQHCYTSKLLDSDYKISFPFSSALLRILMMANTGDFIA